MEGTRYYPVVGNILVVGMDIVVVVVDNKAVVVEDSTHCFVVGNKVAVVAEVGSIHYSEVGYNSEQDIEVVVVVCNLVESSRRDAHQPAFAGRKC